MLFLTQIFMGEGIWFNEHTKDKMIKTYLKGIINRVLSSRDRECHYSITLVIYQMLLYKAA